MTGVTLKGFKEFEDKLKNLSADVLQEVDAEVEDSALLWVQGAVSAAPVDQGQLKQRIGAEKAKQGEWTVVSPVDYSAFIEWGTRTRVVVPAELQAYAAQFRGATNQKNAKEFIYEWCRRKGIEKSKWFLIYRSIMVNGIHPHPFFFIQHPKVENFLVDNVRKVLNTPH